ncbi:MAG: asparagine synthase (glutamine-hydrolyzing) [Raineya sp.]|nr:asparagine synthase (glutamine-hydrolyzing) [Raineya sp.]MDW8297072.1 asparagine synthase (glutamine-hydrolyzing) [Raineya sp.]
MCGILGVIPCVADDIFENALHALLHRGPDGYGIWKNENIILGHRRLAILDLSDRGKQPMIWQNRWVITFNGEIYNFVEIKKELQKKGYQFFSDTDTEVILASYQEWGGDCLSKFNGMWAIAIWDKLTKQLFLARDRFGVKPLFYYWSEGKFIFASEMKAIAKLLPQVELSPYFEWCLNHIYEYETQEYTLIKGIKKIPAGHYAIFDVIHQNFSLHKYWDTFQNLQDLHLTYEQEVEKLKELFQDACAIRTRSDVPVGTALSGGLDSSSVAAFIRQAQLQQNIQKAYKVFVAIFPDTELDEQEYAKAVVEHLGIEAIFQEISKTDSVEKLEEYLWYFEEIYLTSPVPMTEIYKSMRKHNIIVSLDGHGGDELLAGYGNALFNIVKDNPFDCKLIQDIIETYKALRNINNSKRWKYFIDGFEGRKNLIRFYLREVLKIPSHQNLYQQKLGYFNFYLYNIFHNTILPTLLRNYDRYSMTASVEVRMPFMDYRVVTFLFSLSWQSKFRNGFTKAILRDAVKDYLPNEVVWRKSKTGFGTPFTQWLKGVWKEYFLDLTHSADFYNSAFINQNKVKKMLYQILNTENATVEQGREFWKEIVPFLWEKSFYKKLQNGK